MAGHVLPSLHSSRGSLLRVRRVTGPVHLTVFGGMDGMAMYDRVLGRERVLSRIKIKITHTEGER